MQMKTWNKVRTSLLRRNKYDRDKRMDMGANSKKGYSCKNNNLSICTWMERIATNLIPH